MLRKSVCGKNLARPNSQAGQMHKDKIKRRKQIERLSRKILFLIRWSSFDNYWDVVDVLEDLAFEYRQMLGDAGEIIREYRELVKVHQKETQKGGEDYAQK